ncbi:ferrochelatase [Sulfurospirillum deleyianum]|uniref:Ferrochelatase n=1 Tax=Sulfurospirillum deleyianum (strain ATCC 51133 / DSM 6946 / 5175) TaxID=525898 RepID=D1B3L5_SULD5|nr:ferrochelatase [Sulfurospirillum deleyianum]ACZ12685.1 ferrochelatase [Sulfurospirillum deleyianum DSM 6946]
MAQKALILLNMGGPNNLDEVKLFLTNMFNDKNIITTKSALLRRFIAFMITASRTKKAQANYAKLGGKSPLVGYTQKLVDKLQKALPSVHVDFAMRYTPPFCEEVIRKLLEKEIHEVTLLPLYPHYSSTTTKSSVEDFMEVAHLLGYHGKINVIDRFYEDASYNQLLIQKIKETLGKHDASNFELIFSAHSLPQKIIEKGDPYQREIELHVKILSELLVQQGIHFHGIHLAYQSKLGPLKWLEPSLEQKLSSLENKNALIVPIAFTIDNSETEFELSMEYAEVAHHLGYEHYLVAKCPNDDDAFVSAIKGLCS